MLVGKGMGQKFERILQPLQKNEHDFILHAKIGKIDEHLTYYLPKSRNPKYSPWDTIHIPKGIFYNYSKGRVKECPQNTNEKIKLVFIV